MRGRKQLLTLLRRWDRREEPIPGAELIAAVEGLPIGYADLADVIGFDVDDRRIDALKCKVDWTGEVPAERLKRVDLQFTNHIRRADGCTFFIVTVGSPRAARLAYSHAA